MDVSKLVTVRQASEAIPAYSQAALRYLIFREHENGLAEAGAVHRVGRRVLLDLDAFGAWIEGGAGR